MRPYATLVAAGAVLAIVAALAGGRGAGVGGGIAVLAQLAAVLLLRPAMTAPQQVFMARWYAGMGVRALVLGTLLAVSATHRTALPLVETVLGYIAVLLPLLFLETRFLK
ncbi:MAG TPA: hypothetical protein VKB63_14030 [Gemmatimonadales bacterium]|nr:hypothetical protein [Gemmatimonadales bacterium]